MEAAGLVVGVAGLAGLFTSLMDAVDRVNDYRSFTADSKALGAQFDGYRAQLARWGREVGLNNGQLSTDHQAILDPQTMSAATQLLQIANEILEPGEPSGIKAKGPSKFNTLDQPGSRRSVPANSRRAKLGWALGGKAEQTAKVKSFGKIVQQLSQLVPSQPTEYAKPGHTQVSVFEVIHPSLDEFFAEIRQMNAEAAAERKAYMKHELTKWLLGDVTPNETYRDSLHKRLPGTCEWIFSQPEFLQWNMKDSSESKHPLLWIHGHAGFGKTVLCAQIVRQLMSKDDYPVAHFFFSSDFASRDDPYVALRSWVLQLASNNTVAFELACDMWNDVTDQVMASRDIIIQLLRQILLDIPWCTLVIDGLDECTKIREASGNIESFLLDLRSVITETTRVLIVSRDEPEIRQALECNDDQDSIHFKISPDHVRCDTDILSHHIVNKKLPNKTEEMKKDLSERLSSRCDGQFIWLMMQTVSLRKGSNFMALKRAIDETPTGLNQLYQRNWNSILAQEERDRRQAFALLRWAAFSSRPLTVCEMAEAVLLDESAEDFPIDELPDAIDDDYIDTEILGLCGALLEVRHQLKDEPPKQRTVHVAHFSVREYLIYQLPIGNLKPNESLRLSNERAHRSLLSRLCLVYITCNRSWAATNTLGFEKCFRSYAASSWHSYLASGTEDEGDSELVGLTLEFMKETHPCWSSWRQWFDEQDEDEDAQEEAEAATGVSGALYYSLRLGLGEISYRLALSQAFSPSHKQTGRSPLHLACSQGNSKVVSALLRQISISQVNTCGFRGRTPLYSAAMGGHTAVAQVLLQTGADQSIANKNGLTPLNSAALGGHLDTVRLLLDRGSDLSIADNDGWTPLDSAASVGHTETVRLLLDRGANLSIADNDGWTPLNLAVSDGHLEIVRLLLDQGADLSIANNDGWTPLHTASQGHLEIVRLLLDQGANLSITDNDGWTPLHTASQGHLEIVRLLLDQGANLSIADNDGWTPLNLAVSDDHLEIVRLLLDHGADLSITDNNGWTPLHIASQGHLEIVRLLLDQGANLSIANNDGWTPLYSAVLGGHLDIVHLFIDKGANLFTTNTNSSWTPLHLAALNGHLKIVRLLLEQGADLSIATNNGWTPLYLAVLGGHLKVVCLLLNQGADMFLTTNDGWTPLCSAASKGHLEIVRLLLDQGADLSIAANNGWTPFHLAASNGHLEIVRLLLDQGADLSITANNGWTPLHLAVSKGNLEIACLLLNHGADMSIATNNGWTPLCSAAFKGHLKIVRLLLDQGADLSIATNNGWTPLHLAVSKGHLEIVRLLLDQGANISVATNYGWTPLIRAAFENHLGIVDLLLERLPNSSTTDSKAEALITQSSRFVNTPALHTTFSKNEVNAVDNIGRTALFLASRQGHTEIVRALLSYKYIESWQHDRFNSTALHAAVINGHCDTVKLLLGALTSYLTSHENFDWTIDSSTLRSGSLEVSCVLREWLQKYGAPLKLEDLPNISKLALFDKDLPLCDGCTRPVSPKDMFYACPTCLCGNFHICEECMKAGVQCLDNSHTLELREPNVNTGG